MRPDPPVFDRAAHWQQVYQTKADRATSWFQEEPLPSLELIRASLPRPGRVVDVGGGASALAPRLTADGHYVTVLDVSAAAIARAQARAGALAERIRWIVGDVTELNDIGAHDVWHDRAVLHFLTANDERRRYAALASRSIVAGGHLSIATFGVNGPEKCSGLPVVRYDEPALAAAFAPAFTMVRSFTSAHVTPWGKAQEFCFAVLRTSGTGR